VFPTNITQTNQSKKSRTSFQPTTNIISTQHHPTNQHHHSSTTTRHVVLTRWVADDELPAPALGDGETARHLGSWTDALIDRIDRIGRKDRIDMNRYG
jgi:hypothetical protein